MLTSHDLKKETPDQTMHRQTIFRDNDASSIRNYRDVKSSVRYLPDDPSIPLHNSVSPYKDAFDSKESSNDDIHLHLYQRTLPLNRQSDRNDAAEERFNTISFSTYPNGQPTSRFDLPEPSSREQYVSRNYFATKNSTSVLASSTLSNSKHPLSQHCTLDPYPLPLSSLGKNQPYFSNYSKLPPKLQSCQRREFCDPQSLNNYPSDPISHNNFSRDANRHEVYAGYNTPRERAGKSSFEEFHNNVSKNETHGFSRVVSNSDDEDYAHQEHGSTFPSRAFYESDFSPQPRNFLAAQDQGNFLSSSSSSSPLSSFSSSASVSERAANIRDKRERELENVSWTLSRPTYQSEIAETRSAPRLGNSNQRFSRDFIAERSDLIESSALETTFDHDHPSFDQRVEKENVSCDWSRETLASRDARGSITNREQCEDFARVPDRRLRDEHLKNNSFSSSSPASAQNFDGRFPAKYSTKYDHSYPGIIETNSTSSYSSPLDRHGHNSRYANDGHFTNRCNVPLKEKIGERYSRPSGRYNEWPCQQRFEESNSHSIHRRENVPRASEKRIESSYGHDNQSDHEAEKKREDTDGYVARHVVRSNSRFQPNLADDKRDDNYNDRYDDKYVDRYVDTYVGGVRSSHDEKRGSYYRNSREYTRNDEHYDPMDHFRGKERNNQLFSSNLDKQNTRSSRQSSFYVENENRSGREYNEIFKEESRQSKALQSPSSHTKYPSYSEICTDSLAKDRELSPFSSRNLRREGHKEPCVSISVSSQFRELTRSSKERENYNVLDISEKHQSKMIRDEMSQVEVPRKEISWKTTPLQETLQNKEHNLLPERPRERRHFNSLPLSGFEAKEKMEQYHSQMRESSREIYLEKVYGLVLGNVPVCATDEQTLQVLTALDPCDFHSLILAKDKHAHARVHSQTLISSLKQNEDLRELVLDKPLSHSCHEIPHKEPKDVSESLRPDFTSSSSSSQAVVFGFAYFRSKEARNRFYSLCQPFPYPTEEYLSKRNSQKVFQDSPSLFTVDFYRSLEIRGESEGDRALRQCLGGIWLHGTQLQCEYPTRALSFSSGSVGDGTLEKTNREISPGTSNENSGTITSNHAFNLSLPPLDTKVFIRSLPNSFYDAKELYERLMFALSPLFSQPSSSSFQKPKNVQTLGFSQTNLFELPPVVKQVRVLSSNAVQQQHPRTVGRSATTFTSIFDPSLPGESQEESYIPSSSTSSALSARFAFVSLNTLSNAQIVARELDGVVLENRVSQHHDYHNHSSRSTNTRPRPLRTALSERAMLFSAPAVIYVRNLPADVTLHEILCIFSPYGALPNGLRIVRKSPLHLRKKKTDIQSSALCGDPAELSPFNNDVSEVSTTSHIPTLEDPPMDFSGRGLVNITAHFTVSSSLSQVSIDSSDPLPKWPSLQSSSLSSSLSSLSSLPSLSSPLSSDFAANSDLNMVLSAKVDRNFTTYAFVTLPDMQAAVLCAEELLGVSYRGMVLHVDIKKKCLEKFTAALAESNGNNSNNANSNNNQRSDSSPTTQGPSKQSHPSLNMKRQKTRS